MNTVSGRKENAGEATSNFDLRTRGVHRARPGMQGDESLVLVMVVAMHSGTGHTSNDSGDELERMINHGVTPQQDGLRCCALPLVTSPNVTDPLAGNKRGHVAHRFSATHPSQKPLRSEGIRRPVAGLHQMLPLVAFATNRAADTFYRRHDGSSFLSCCRQTTCCSNDA
jgi:hypothetical protein